MATSLGTIWAEIGIKLDKFNKGIDEAERRFAVVGKTLTSVGKGLTLGVTLPIATAAGGILKLGMQFDEAFDKIRIGTGTTGEAMAALQEDFRAVYTTVPSGMADVSTAIADLNTRTGLAGEPLRELSTQILNLSRIAGTDLKTTIEASTRLFGDWSIETDQMSDAMDYLFRVSQSTGIGVERLSEKLVQFGAPLRQLGFDFETSAALMGKFEEEGVNTELVMGSLRIALGKLADQGVKDAGAALTEIKNRIKEAGTAGEANAIAIETFGARAGPDMAAAIREGRFEIDNLINALNASTETINGVATETADFSEQLAILRNRASVALEPLGAELTEAVNEAMPALENLIKKITELVNWFTELESSTQKNILGFVAFAAAIGPVTYAVGKLVTAISILAKGFTALKAAAAAAKVPLGVFIGIKALVAAKVLAVIAAIAALAKGVYLLIENWEKVGPFFTDLWNNITIAVSEGAQEVKDWFNTMGEDVGKTLSTLHENARERFDAIVKYLTELPGKIREAIVTFFTETLPHYIGYGIGTAVRLVLEGRDDVVKYFSELPGKIGKWLTQVVTDILTWAGDIRQTVIREFPGIITRIVGFFGELPGRIWTWLVNVVNDIVRWGGNLATEALNTAARLRNSFIDGITGLPGEVVRIFNNVVSSISNFGSQLWDAAKTTASNLWKGFREGLGIKSPSYIEKAMENILIKSDEMLRDMKHNFSSLNRIKVNMPSLQSEAMISDYTKLAKMKPVTTAMSANKQVDKQIADTIAQSVYMAMRDALRVTQAESKAQDIILEIDGIRIGRAVLPTIVREAQRLGTPVFGKV